MPKTTLWESVLKKLKTIFFTFLMLFFFYLFLIESVKKKPWKNLDTDSFCIFDLLVLQQKL